MDFDELEDSLSADAAVVAALVLEGRTAEADVHVERSGFTHRLLLWRDCRETRNAPNKSPATGR